MNSTLVFTVVAAASLVSGVASADPPATLAGTTWTLQVNADSDQLVIHSQMGPGAPGGPTCRLIKGELGFVGVPITGIYCPASGRITFLHNNLHSGVTVRIFTGDVLGGPDQVPSMQGTMTVVNHGGFGPYGEYAFSATQ